MVPRFKGIFAASATNEWGKPAVLHFKFKSLLPEGPSLIHLSFYDSVPRQNQLFIPCSNTTLLPIQDQFGFSYLWRDFRADFIFPTAQVQLQFLIEYKKACMDQQAKALTPTVKLLLQHCNDLMAAYDTRLDNYLVQKIPTVQQMLEEATQLSVASPEILKLSEYFKLQRACNDFLDHAGRLLVMLSDATKCSQRWKALISKCKACMEPGTQPVESAPILQTLHCDLLDLREQLESTLLSNHPIEYLKQLVTALYQEAVQGNANMKRARHNQTRMVQWNNRMTFAAALSTSFIQRFEAIQTQQKQLQKECNQDTVMRTQSAQLNAYMLWVQIKDVYMTYSTSPTRDVWAVIIEICFSLQCCFIELQRFKVDSRPSTISIQDVETYFDTRLFYGDTKPPVQHVYWWLFGWCGFNDYNWHERDSLKVVYYVRFLRKLLEQRQFFFGYGVESSYKLLMSKPVGTFILRLSSSCAGMVTLTYRANTPSVHHKRYFIVGNFLMHQYSQWSECAITEVNDLIKEARLADSSQLTIALTTSVDRPSYCDGYIQDHQ